MRQRLASRCRLCEIGRARRRRESLCPLVLLTKPPPLSIRLRRAPPASSLRHRTTRSCHRQLPVSPIWTRRVPRPMANSPPFAISRGISPRGVGSYNSSGGGEIVVEPGGRQHPALDLHEIALAGRRIGGVC